MRAAQLRPSSGDQPAARAAPPSSPGAREIGRRSARASRCAGDQFLGTANVRMQNASLRVKGGGWAAFETNRVPEARSRVPEAVAGRPVGRASAMESAEQTRAARRAQGGAPSKP